MIAATNIFLPRLVDEFVARGGRIVVRSFAAREELGGLAEPHVGDLVDVLPVHLVGPGRLLAGEVPTDLSLLDPRGTAALDELGMTDQSLRRMQDELGGTTDRYVADRTAKTCLLLPGATGDPKKRARSSAASDGGRAESALSTTVARLTV